MKEISLEELKRIELDILMSVDNFCDKHKLRYYLCGGTLLGAVRHQGFIPWDDDIDIIMPRDDYMKFLKLYNKENFQYRVHSSYNDVDWYTTFAEVEDIRTVKRYFGFSRNDVVGVNIDIFPIDGAPENYIIRRLYWGMMNILSRIAILSYQNFKVSKHYCDREVSWGMLKTAIRTTVKFLVIPFAKITRVFNINLIVNNIAGKFDVNQSKYIGCITFPHYGYKECVEAKNFLERKKRMFEGVLFSTPLNYDEYLSNLYGDYLIVPPKDKQVTHHDFAAYWRDGY